MRVGDYVRTKDYNGFPGGIAKIKEIRNDKKHKMDWLTLDKTLDHISFLEQSTNVVKSSPNIIDLLEVGDVIRYEIETPLETSGILKGVGDVTDEEMLEKLKKDKAFHVKSIVTREQFSQMEYKVGE